MADEDKSLNKFKDIGGELKTDGTIGKLKASGVTYQEEQQPAPPVTATPIEKGRKAFNVAATLGTLGGGLGVGVSPVEDVDVNVSAHTGGFLTGSKIVGTVDWQPLKTQYKVGLGIGEVKMSGGVFGGVMYGERNANPVFGPTSSSKGFDPLVGAVGSVEGVDSGLGVSWRIGLPINNYSDFGKKGINPGYSGFSVFKRF